MRYLIIILLANLLFTNLAMGAANCAHSQSWQCQGHHSNSAQNSQTGSGISTSGNSPNQSTSNQHLGSAQPTQPTMTLQPIVPATVTGYGVVPSGQAKSPVNVTGPGKVPPQPVYNVPPVPVVPTQPIQVNPTPTPVVTGAVMAPQQPVYNVPPVPVVPTQPIQVNPTPTPVVTGTGMVPPQPVYKVPPVATPPIPVGATPTLPVTGFSKAPDRPVIKLPPRAPNPVLPIQAYLIPVPTLTGQPMVPTPQVVNAPPKPQVPVPPKQLYPSLTPVIIGQPKVSISQPGTHTLGNQPLPGTTGTGATHLLVSGLSGQQVIAQSTGNTGQTSSNIDPRVSHKTVSLYQGKYAQRALYKNTVSMDKNGFYLTVLGTKEPVFTGVAESTPAATKEPLANDENHTVVAADTFVFFFDFASVDVHPEQLGLYDKVIEAYSSSGKHLIVMGETDHFGSQEYNTNLAIHRSTTIINELKSRGVKDSDIELKVLVRCCRQDQPTEASLIATRTERITWVHLE